jgi:hypothetical protein
MLDNAVDFFYPDESSFEACTPQMLDSPSMISQDLEVLIPPSQLGRSG